MKPETRHGTRWALHDDEGIVIVLFRMDVNTALHIGGDTYVIGHGGWPIRVTKARRDFGSLGQTRLGDFGSLGQTRLGLTHPFMHGIVNYNADGGADGAAAPPKTVPTISYPKAVKNEPSAPDGTPADRVCIVCMDRAVATVAVPCGHAYACITCVCDSKPTTCAMCRAPLEKIIQLF
jgi:hypothetical protein